MKSTSVSLTHVRNNLGALVERVRSKKERIMLEKGGVPVAALVDVDALEDLQDTLEILHARIETQGEKLVDWQKVRKLYV